MEIVEVVVVNSREVVTLLEGVGLEEIAVIQQRLIRTARSAILPGTGPGVGLHRPSGV
jgi:hypothetical protein